MRQKFRPLVDGSGEVGWSSPMPRPMSTRPTEQSNAAIEPASRRAVLRGISLAGLAASSAAALTAPAKAATEKPQSSADHRKLDYRETDHIRTFYESARR